MKKKTSRYTRTTITVPTSLHARMRKLRGVNWSNVAATAFRRQLEREGNSMFANGHTPPAPPDSEIAEALRRVANRIITELDRKYINRLQVSGDDLAEALHYVADGGK